MAAGKPSTAFLQPCWCREHQRVSAGAIVLAEKIPLGSGDSHYQHIHRGVSVLNLTAQCLAPMGQIKCKVQTLTLSCSPRPQLPEPCG